MKKTLLLLAGALSAISLSGQTTALETFNFTGGSLIGENGTSGVGTVSTTLDFNGDIDNAINLDGTQSINYGNVGLDATNGISFSFWLKPTSNLSGAYAVFGKRNVCTNTNMVEANLNGTNKTVSLALRTSSGRSMAVSTGYLEDTWQRFTFTISKADGKVRAYRNGEYKGIASTGITPSLIPNTFLGDFLIADGPCVDVDGTQNYKGGFDDLEIYNSTLTDIEVQSNFDVLSFDDSVFREKLVDQSLLVHYSFDSTLADQVTIDETHINDYLDNTKNALRVENNKAYDLGNSTISTSNGLTFSFWIKPDVMSGTNIVFDKRSVCTWDNMFAVNANGTNNSLSFELRSTAQKAMSVTVPYTPEIWQKITFTIDNTAGKVYSYINGQLSNESTIVAGSIPATFTTNANLTLGDGICFTSSNTRYDGGIDELYIYEETLTPTQIADAYANDDDEQVNWVVKEDFDNLSKFYYQEVEITERFDLATTVEDTALYLDGSTNYSLGNPAINTLATEGYTFSFWINPEAGIGVNQMLFSKRNVCTWTNMFAFSVNGGTDKVTAEFRTTTQKVKTLTTGYVPGEWQQMTFTVDLTEKMIRGYRNGVKIDSSTIVGNEFVTNYSSANLLIASDPCNVTKYTGGLDEVKIYSIPLNDNEVLGNFHSEVVTGAFDYQEKETLSIYPNPASDLINTEVGQLELFDALGNVILNIESTGKVDVSNLESGIYFVIQNGKRTKLIIE